MNRSIALAFICMVVTLSLVETGVYVIRPEIVVFQRADAQANSTALGNNQMSPQTTSSIEEIKNMTTTEMAILEEISLTSTKLATQGAYTALTVFFLGLGLVIFGLRLTSKPAKSTSKYLLIMVWALTIPVLAIVAIYQYGALTNSIPNLFLRDEPFLLLSLLMYIPIGIVLFLLFTQKKIAKQSNADESSDWVKANHLLVIERLTSLKEKGALKEDEIEKLKKMLIDKL